MINSVLTEEIKKYLEQEGWTLTNEDHTVNTRKEVILKVSMGNDDTDCLTTVIPYHEILELKFIKVKE